MTAKLTREQIAAITADELRLAVAEYVVGWQPCHYYFHDVPKNAIFPPNFEIDSSKYTSGYHPKDALPYGAPADYPGDIAAAWQVIEKVRGWVDTNNDAWDCFMVELGYESMRDLIYNINPTAICRAALMAVMSEME